MSSESELIDAFLAPFGGGEGVGSDCATLSPSPGMKLVATTDAVVEGVHFSFPRFSPEDVGWKALAVNLSDLAAAGARPRWFLCALGIPRGGAARAVRIARGMAPLARKAGCAIVGGNVTRAAEWSVTITALGEAARPLDRTGARPGDALVVAGKLGDAAAGLSGVRAGLKAQKRPVPLVDEGLRAARYASAAIDVSDGFLRDLSHLCRMSGVGAEVECSALPLGPAATLETALSGGEDYALLYSVPPRRLAALQRAVACAVVGRVSREPGVRLTLDGKPRALPRTLGFDHVGRSTLTR